MKVGKLLLMHLLVLCSVGAFAQPDPEEDGKGPVRDWINTKRIGFYTDKVGFTPAEAQVFWPVYNEYTKEIHDLRSERKKNRKQVLGNLNSLDNATIEKELDEEFVFRQKELDIEKKYLGEWKKILPMKKVALLLKAEQEFKIWILNEWRDQGPGPRHNGPPAQPGGPPPPRGGFDR